MKNVLVVSNFNAGRKKAIKYRKKLQKFLLENSTGFKFITIDELNQVNFSHFDSVIALGGDGTVNKIAPYIINTNISLGIIPCGTANLLAQKLGISQDLNKAIKTLKNENTTQIDTIKINNKFCILRTGFGWDADIITKTPQSLKNKFGYFAYFIAGILFALRLKNKQYTINNKTIEASCVIISNASNMYRNIISTGKNTKLDDGLADIFILKTQNPFIFLFEIIKMFFCAHKNSKHTIYYKTDNLVLENNWINSHIDGEKRIFQENIEIKILNKSLKVII